MTRLLIAASGTGDISSWPLAVGRKALPPDFPRGSGGSALIAGAGAVPARLTPLPYRSRRGA